jgi:hypothetical protein
MQRYTFYLYLETALHALYWNILTMHGPINVKSPNNTSKWQMGFNSAFKGLNINYIVLMHVHLKIAIQAVGRCICGFSLAGNEGTKPAGGIDVCGL